MCPEKDEPSAKRLRGEDSTPGPSLPIAASLLDWMGPEESEDEDEDGRVPEEHWPDPPPPLTPELVAEGARLGMPELVERVERELSKRTLKNDGAFMLLQVVLNFLEGGWYAGKEEKTRDFVRYMLRRGVGYRTVHVKHILNRVESAAIVRIYLDEMPDQVRGEVGHFGLLAAARGGRPQTMVAFLEAGVNPNARMFGNFTALHFAAFYGRAVCVRELLSHGADANAKDSGGGTPLHKACARGNVKCVRELIEKFADVNAKENNGWTPLHEACYWRKAECVQELLRRGVAVNVKDNLGKIPLHRACVQGNAEVVRSLLDRGADVRAEDNCGWTPLHFACFRGSEECARELLCRGADKDAKDKGGRTPFHRAVERGHKKRMQELLANGLM